MYRANALSAIRQQSGLSQLDSSEHQRCVEHDDGDNDAQWKSLFRPTLENYFAIFVPKINAAVLDIMCADADDYCQK